jgi:tetratricopeptide (TPR) repeat protein
VKQIQRIWQKSYLPIATFGLLICSLSGGAALRAHSLISHLSGHYYASAATDSNDLLNLGIKNFQQGNYKGAVDAFDRALVRNPNDARVYYNRGLLLFQLGDESAALSDFDRALQLNPLYATAYFHRAGARLSLGDQSGGIQDLRLASKLFREQGDRANYQKVQTLLRQLMGG